MCPAEPHCAVQNIFTQNPHCAIASSTAAEVTKWFIMFHIHDFRFLLHSRGELRCCGTLHSQHYTSYRQSGRCRWWDRCSPVGTTTNTYRNTRVSSAVVRVYSVVGIADAGTRSSAPSVEAPALQKGTHVVLLLLWPHCIPRDMCSQHWHKEYCRLVNICWL
jgi:hypothetical protein